MSFNLSSSEIRFVNYCRLFLDVMSLADITDEQGAYIVPEAWVRLKAHRTSVRNRARGITAITVSPTMVSMEKNSFTIIYASKQTPAQDTTTSMDCGPPER
jgi:hypothetical protein